MIGMPPAAHGFISLMSPTRTVALVSQSYYDQAPHAQPLRRLPWRPLEERLPKGQDCSAAQAPGRERTKIVMPSALHNVLNIPQAYRLFQEKLGFADARRKAFERWLEFDPGARIIDIGCGPGHILKFLPQDIDYIGFDVDLGYIQQAKKDYGQRAQFHHRVFDQGCLSEFGNADVVMLNGVLHHMSDDLVAQCLDTAHAALKDGGVVFTLDGCYQSGQSRIAKILLDLDRGRYVRRRKEYEALMSATFPNFESHLANDLSAIPYTLIIMVGKR